MNETWKELAQAVQFPQYLQCPLVSDYPDFTGEFKEKLEFVLKFRKHKPYVEINFENFSWMKCEVGDMSGNKLLRALVAICRNQEMFRIGSCMILTINGDPDAALYRLNSGWLEVTTPSPKNIENRKFYDKLFNERKCSFMKQSKEFKEYYADEKLSGIRSNLFNKLKNFLQNPIVETDLNYRRAFIGLLQELFKFELEEVPVFNMTSSIPVAVCIFLAAKFCLSFKLQELFGDLTTSAEELFANWRKENPEVSVSEMKLRLPKAKVKPRLNAAKVILNR